MSIKQTIVAGLSMALLGAGMPTRAEQTSMQNTKDELTTVPEGRAAVNFHPIGSTTLPASSGLSDRQVPYPAFPVKRLQPLIELGDAFLNHGPIRPGIKLPTGQMLQPQFLLFGSLRSALQTYDDGTSNRAEWGNRLDLHANMNLSGTERLLLSLRPLDSRYGDFTGYAFNPDRQAGWQDATNVRLTQLFFEGDIGEIFPGLDPTDSQTYDIGFSVGRQLLLLQDGVLANDLVDMVGLTRNSLVFSGIANLRLTGMYGWSHLRRGANDVLERNDPHAANLYALQAEADTALNNTVAFDLVYVDDKRDSNAWYVGASTTQRLGRVNSTFRVNASIPEQASRTVSEGVLLLSQLSLTPGGTDDLLYCNTFWNSGHFTSATRGPDQGSPIANLGLLYAPVGMGRYGIPLGNDMADNVGFALGYQKFLVGIERQWVLEIAGRTPTTDNLQHRALAVGARYQHALDKRQTVRFDTFVTAQEQHDTAFGFRTEWMVKF